MKTLRDITRWRAVAIGGDAASDYALQIGEAGAGGPLALITAGIHGDEGPLGRRGHRPFAG